MTKEQCLAELDAIAQSGDLIALAQSHDQDALKRALTERMSIPVDAYLVGRKVFTERQQLAREFGDRDTAPETELVLPMKDILAG